MTCATFLFAILALLMAPGPTNTLLALAGAQQGWQRALRLIPAEMLGYLATVPLLAWLGATSLARWPLAAPALKGAAAVWVLYLAVRLWRAPGRQGGPARVTRRSVGLTTLLNPKALVVGLILIPAPGRPDFLPRLALFFLVVPLVALVWSGGGALAGRHGSPARTRLIQRLASICLMVLSASLTAAVLRA
ncbi:MAG TPA: hypothetical protein VFF98_01560 [Novosphingobium sp.]|nr:hypothetical protein [Novosphingobium sp.]